VPENQNQSVNSCLYIRVEISPANTDVVRVYAINDIRAIYLGIFVERSCEEHLSIRQTPTDASKAVCHDLHGIHVATINLTSPLPI
jgi:hypothetical protein